MKKLISHKENFFYWATLGVILIIYLFNAPHTVQTGDSGELTAAAYKLLVAHPPGYPLWIWLNHIWISIIAVGTHFFTFALFNILTAMFALWVLSKCINSKFVQIFSIITLGFCYLFWRYAEIPEVFILNVLLAFSIIWSGSSDKKLAGTQIPVATSVMPILFSLAIAHHLTIVYLMPFILYVCWKHRRHLSLYMSITLGVALCVGLYLSMQLMHPEHMYSWGNLSDIKAVWDHFLRKDYGTFVLHSTSGEASSTPILLYFFKTLLLSTLPLFALAIFAAAQKYRTRERIITTGWEISLWISIALYIALFLGIMQVELAAYWIETTARFFVLPISLFVLALGIFIGRNFTAKSDTLIVAISSIFVAFGAYSHIQFSNYNDFSENTIIEDLAMNLLNISSEFPQPFIFLGKDNFVFPARYMQVVEELHPQTILAGSITPKFPEFTKKLHAKHPDFKAPSDVTGLTIHTLDKVFISPNSDKFTFIAMEDLYPSTLFKITYLPVGFTITPGKGIDFHKSKFTPRFRSDSSLIKTPFYEFDQFRDVFSQYTQYFMAKALFETENKNYLQAIDNYERALGLAPYTGQALLNLCQLKAKEKIPDHKCSFQDTVKTYFDYYSFNKR